MKEIAEKTKVYPHHNVLDVGTGKGQFIPDLKILFPNFVTITGVDPSKEAIGQARETYKSEKGVEFLVMDTNSMTFKGNTFDVISISNVLHHLPPNNNLFSEIKRVLKPGGLLFVVELYQDNQTDLQQTHILQHHYRAEVDTRNNVFHGYTFKRHQVIEYLSAQSVQIIEVDDFSDKKRMNSSNPTYMNTVIEGVKKSIVQTKNFADSKDFEERGNKILERISAKGFMMPNQLIALCKFRID
jgi:ubiquinone/menaquinone biosynthesis C-methylase UbiE